MSISHTLITQLVTLALDEDLNYQTAQEGDITAQLIPQNEQASAKVITREDCIFCGKDIILEVFKQVDPTVNVTVLINDGDTVKANSTLFTASGSARSILTAERTALNFVQTLSGTATTTAHYVKELSGTTTQLLDTRKTTPGMRHLEKYAVHCGGGVNHRMGLYDAIMIKDNHIDLLGGMENALLRLDNPSKLPVIVEVRTIDELAMVMKHGQGKVTRVLLDNMSVSQLSDCLELNKRIFETEASGGISLGNIRDIANTGVDFASVGALTHSAGSLDLSMKAVK